jgi:hypothetical protein
MSISPVLTAILCYRQQPRATATKFETMFAFVRTEMSFLLRGYAVLPVGAAGDLSVRFG